MRDDQFFSEQLAALRKSGMIRTLRNIRGSAGPVVDLDGRKALMLCSNDYLGLSTDPRMKAAASKATETYGTGATGSRLISGNSELYAKLERDLASFKGTEAALVFSSGYHANLGAITSLVGPGDAIFSDQLNHASIIDGTRLSRAEVNVYRHCDANDLETALRRSSSAGRKLVITESVFSMDGDTAPLQELAAVAQRHGALLMVDDAHGTGVVGERGAGVVEALGLTGQVDVQMGTFSKALASLGGYVAGSRKLIEFLLNRARSFVFTTGLPPAVLAASIEALRLVQAEPGRRECLQRHARRLREGLKEGRLSVGQGYSQIVPVMIGDERTTMAACRYLLRLGIFVQGIRPPTVPLGTARLRLAPMATHTDGQIAEALQVFLKLAGLLNSRRSWTN